MRQVENGPNCLPMLNVAYPVATRTHLLYWILDEWGRWTDVSDPGSRVIGGLCHSFPVWNYRRSNKPNGSRAQFGDGCSTLSIPSRQREPWMVRTSAPSAPE